MNAKNQATFGTLDNLVTLFKNNSATVAIIVAFSNAASSHSSIISAIRSANQVQVGKSTGAGNKKVAKEKLAEFAFNVAGAVFAYASTINDTNLKKNVNFTLTDLKKRKDEILEQVCKNILEIATTNLANLAPFGITNTILSSLESAISEYTNKVTDPAIVVTQKKIAGKNIIQLFKEANTVIKEQLDKTINLLQETNPEFVKKYKELRKTKAPATTVTQLEITVLTVEETPIKARVLITPDKALLTNAEGIALFKPVEPATYNVKVIANGFKERNLPNVITKLDQRKKIKIVLSPSA